MMAIECLGWAMMLRAAQSCYWHITTTHHHPHNTTGCFCRTSHSGLWWLLSSTEFMAAWQPCFQRLIACKDVVRSWTLVNELSHAAHNQCDEFIFRVLMLISRMKNWNLGCGPFGGWGHWDCLRDLEDWGHGRQITRWGEINYIYI